MRVLLDTHALVWVLTDPSRLSARVRSLVVDRSTELVVSAATAWEIATKVRIGKFGIAEPIAADYPDHLSRLGAQELPISGRHALRAGSLRWDHRDPFDRILAAQAILEDLPFITKDEAFADLIGLDTLW